VTVQIAAERRSASSRIGLRRGSNSPASSSLPRISVTSGRALHAANAGAARSGIVPPNATTCVTARRSMVCCTRFHSKLIACAASPSAGTRVIEPFDV
jgi:hypothetical protein